jgi:HTH-type transcriptional regulator, competence development regulator
MLNEGVDQVKKFGATVRELRENKQISLRKFAEKVGVSPTFQSKVERGDFAPPSVETVKRMAQALEVDPDWLLGLAGKVSSDLPEIVQKRPELMATFLRTADKLSDENIQKIVKQMQKMH